MVQQRGHLFHPDIDRPAKGLTVDFWYGGCGIRHVNVLDYIAGAQQARVMSSPAVASSPSVSVSFDRWVFPKAGVAFVWVLEDELSPSRWRSVRAHVQAASVTELDQVPSA